MAGGTNRRNMATPNRTKSDWIALLQKANAGPKADEVPKGFRPQDDWLKEFDISDATWRRKIPLLEKAREFQRGYFRVIADDGRALKKPFWKRKKSRSFS